MPVYNAELYLAEAVESILNQTFSEFEFIIIDDGSTDKSLSVLRSYAEQDERIKLVTRENKGIVTTRNELLSLARGKFFAIMDSDDISYPERLKRQLGVLEKKEKCLIVGCRDLLIDPEGLPITDINKYQYHKDVDAANLKFNVFQTLNSYMAVTEVVRAIGGYRNDVIYAEDRDIFLRLAEIGQIYVMPDVLYAYRQHYTNTCLLKRNEITRNVFRVVSDAYVRRGLDVNSIEHQLENNVGCMSELHLFSVWGWWALKAGNIKTAYKYAIKLVFKDTFSINTWRLIFCTLRGY